MLAFNLRKSHEFEENKILLSELEIVWQRDEKVEQFLFEYIQKTRLRNLLMLLNWAE